jgi:hypothetical protein
LASFAAIAVAVPAAFLFLRAIACFCPRRTRSWRFDDGTRRRLWRGSGFWRTWPLTAWTALAILRAAFIARWSLVALPRSIALLFSLRALRPGRPRRTGLRERLDRRVASNCVGIDLVRRQVVLFVEVGDGNWFRTHDPLALDELHELWRILAAADDGRFGLGDQSLAAAGRAAPFAAEIGRDVKAGTAH